MSVATNKDEGREQLRTLITAFERDRTTFIDNSYIEAQLRIDFINPFLKALGWDVENEQRASQFNRAVLQEESIDVEDDQGETSKKNPDYTLKVQGTRHLFIEAKKASIDITTSPEAAFQVRRYGWNAGLGMSILTNFNQLVIYDCRYKPDATDAPQVARYRTYTYDEYLDRFDELYNLFSCEAVAQGAIEEIFSVTAPDTITFDEYFLEQIQEWRIQLANSILTENEGFDTYELNLLVQRLINRVIFLRICEDREIEASDILKNITTYQELKHLFQESDQRYNSGLFDFIEDELTLVTELDSEVLIEIFAQLYYPQSPYNFSVVDANILSQIYERFLANRLQLSDTNGILLVNEPEVTASNGVVPTPQIVVKRIIEDTLAPSIAGRDFAALQSLKLADICCGSGTFLIGAFDHLVEVYTQVLEAEGISDPQIIVDDEDGGSQLTLQTKRDILLNNLFGVDINPYAVEVAQFSLLLKLLENENATSVDDYIQEHGNGALPNLETNIKCGNSLIDESYYDFNENVDEDDELLLRIRPFEWQEEFDFLQTTGGFDVIIGNPPYVRVQNLYRFFREEIDFYRESQPGYTTASKDNFDKYYLFIEQAIKLLRDGGRLGYIVPNKFFIVTGGKRLRKYITQNASIGKITHFGVTQVFPDRSTYTAIIVLEKSDVATFDFQRISQLNPQALASPSVSLSYPNSDFGSEPWVFVSPEASRIFTKVKNAGTVPLKDIADIPVGLQTSADEIYIITDFQTTGNTITFSRAGTTWQIEQAITQDCLYDVSFNLFEKPQANAKIIFPYQLNNGSAEVIQEADFQQNYPLCWAYLNHYKTRLSRRSISGGRQGTQTWYQYGRSQSLTKFQAANKLIWPVLSTQQNYGFDDQNIMFTGGGNGPYYSLIPKDNYSIYYLMGILSHPVIEAMVKAGASEFRGAYYSHGKQFLKNLPIKKIDFNSTQEKALHDTVGTQVQGLIAARERLERARIGPQKRLFKRRYDSLFNQLINQISGLHNLSNAEIDIVSGAGLFVAESDTTDE